MKTKLKSLALSHIRGYITAILKDLAWMYGRPSDWERDHSRLHHELGIKGVRLITIDFPALAKHFDQCLDLGLYTPSALPLSRRCSKVIVVPAFLQGLYLRVFDSEGKLRVAPCPDAILGIRTILMGAKKLRLPYKKGSLHEELDQFLICEQAIRNPTLNWVGDDLFDSDHSSSERDQRRSLQGRLGQRPLHLAKRLHLADAQPRSSCQLELALGLDPLRGLDPRLVGTIQQVADIVSSSFGDFHIERPSELPKHGPGVVSDVKVGQSKFDFPNWTSKTDAIFPYDMYGTSSIGEPYSHDRTVYRYTSREVACKLIAVPKTAKGPRLIAAEPSAHQWLQQLILNQLVERLSDTPISASVRFDDQTRNRDFALKGSIDGSFSTIDLSSASDRLSCWSVERFFRANITLLERLHASRTRSARWESREDYPSFGVVLKKFAPMGSACTFPVQSIIYCCVAIAVRLYLSKTAVTTRSIEDASNRCSVFGDDIIVPQNDCPSVISALEYLGLKVNAAKTFYTGKFRESCGIDAWGGYDVTPPYVLTLGNSIRYADGVSSAEVTNNFFTKGFWNTTKYLQELIGPICKIIPITRRGDLGSTFFSYSGASLQHLKRRYNSSLQREEVRCLTTKSSKDRGPSSPASRLFQWFIEKPRPDTHWVSGVASRKDSISSPGWHPVDKFTGQAKYLPRATRVR